MGAALKQICERTRTSAIEGAGLTLMLSHSRYQIDENANDWINRGLTMGGEF
jgi:hypothetical protein